MQVTDPRHVAALVALAEAGIPVDIQELLVQTGALAKALVAGGPAFPPGRFGFGALVGKHSGSWWEGRVVGFYSTAQTPVGYNVQLDMVPNGPVQIYPEAALSAIKPSDVEPRQKAQQSAAHEDEQAKSSDAHDLDPKRIKTIASCNHGSEESRGLPYAGLSMIEGGK